MPHTGVMKPQMTDDQRPYMAVQVEPDEMVQYVHTLIAAPKLAQLQWRGDTSRARAAQLRWDALNRAFGDPRVSVWMTQQKQAQYQVPAALVAAAGVARLTMSEGEVAFDIQTLLDATLQLCEPAGRA
jgi:hypothetical protein